MAKQRSRLADCLQGWNQIADYLNRAPSWCRFMASEGVPEKDRLPVWYLGAGEGTRRGTPCLDPRDADRWVERRRAATLCAPLRLYKPSR